MVQTSATQTVCQSLLTQIFGQTIDSYQIYTQYVDACLNVLDFRVPNADKAAVCFHSGVWTQSAPMTQDYITHYCDNYQTVLGARFEFVESMAPYIQDYSKYMEVCQQQIKSNPDLNFWFDPIAAYPTVSTESLCNSQYQNSGTLMSSYLSSLAVNLDSKMHIDYDECINSIIVDNPQEWAKTYINITKLLHVYSSEERDELSQLTGQQIESECDLVCPNDGVCNSKCDGCLTGLAYIYQQYAGYLDGVALGINEKWEADLNDLLYK